MYGCGVSSCTWYRPSFTTMPRMCGPNSTLERATDISLASINQLHDKVFAIRGIRYNFRVF